MNPYLWKYPSISLFQISVSGLSAHTPGIASITLGVCANGPWCQRLLKNNSKAVILGKEWLTVWQRQRRHKREGRRKKTEGQKEEEWEEKKEQRGEERGRMTGNNFSLEERLHIEKLLSNNTGYIRAHTHTHTNYHSLIYLPFVQFFMCYDKNLNHSPAGLLTLHTFWCHSLLSSALTSGLHVP